MNSKIKPGNRVKIVKTEKDVNHFLQNKTGRIVTKSFAEDSLGNHVPAYLVIMDDYFFGDEDFKRAYFFLPKNIKLLN